MSEDGLPAVLLLDGAGRITAWSEAACRLTGYEADELVGEHWSRLLVGLPPAADGELQVEASLRRRDGGDLTVRVSVLALAGKQERFALVVHASSAQERLAQAAHDLRSPLGIVSGRIELLLHRWDRLDDAERQEYLRAAARGADRASALVSELLER